jgi:uncharacterized damage-inducible protein DinB
MRARRPQDWKKSLLEVWAANEAMNQLLLQHLDDRAWRAEPPAGGRTIAAIFSHIHNDRLLWMTVWAHGRRRPAHTSRHTVTRKQAARALARSARAMAEVFSAEPAPDDAIAHFGWMLAHDAHHRGQICILARQVGYPLRGEGAYGLWQWGKLWKKLGIQHRWPMP